ncbi:MAG: hypothetical protein ABI207_06535 [Crocinitomicaceae bacterium]
MKNRYSPSLVKKRSLRPSPSSSATEYSVGTIKKGNDGKKYIIIKTIRGTKRWKLHSAKKSMKKSMKKKSMKKSMKKKSMKSMKKSMKKSSKKLKYPFTYRGKLYTTKKEEDAFVKKMSRYIF